MDDSHLAYFDRISKNFPEILSDKEILLDFIDNYYEYKAIYIPGQSAENISTKPTMIGLVTYKTGNKPSVSTRKIGNIKFHLKDFMTDSLSLGVSGVENISNPIKLILALLIFFQALSKNTLIEISEDDANLFSKIFLLSKEDKVTIDSLYEYLGNEIDKKKVYASLQRLIKLRCISIADDEILVLEEIRFTTTK